MLLKQKIIYFFMRAIGMITCIKNNRIFFVSFSGESYSDNPKAISEALYEKYGDLYEYIWTFTSNAETDIIPNYIKKCKYRSLLMYYYMCTSKVWVSNFTISKGTCKRSNQYYIQTWHGDKAFKKVLHDVPSRNGRRKFFFETANVDLMIAGSRYGESQIRTAFLYNGAILKKGTPRNDIFFHSNNTCREKIFERYHLDERRKIVMFAPTYRRDGSNVFGDGHISFKTIVDILDAYTNDKWVLFVKTHISDKGKRIEGLIKNRVISVSDYPDTNELLSITDILITDYSSLAGDFALTGKLILLYQFDVKEYTSKDREMYFNIKESPFFRFSDEDSLYAFLKKYKEIDSNSNCEKILKFYGDFETGNSSCEIASIINSLKMEN